jgi:hypothetical protein
MRQDEPRCVAAVCGKHSEATTMRFKMLQPRRQRMSD